MNPIDGGIRHRKKIAILPLKGYEYSHNQLSRYISRGVAKLLKVSPHS